MEKVMAKQTIERNSLKKRLDYQQYEQIRLREAETVQYVISYLLLTIGFVCRLEKKFKNAIKEL